MASDVKCWLPWEIKQNQLETTNMYPKYDITATVVFLFLSINLYVTLYFINRTQVK